METQNKTIPKLKLKRGEFNLNLENLGKYFKHLIYMTYVNTFVNLQGNNIL